MTRGTRIKRQRENDLALGRWAPVMHRHFAKRLFDRLGEVHITPEIIELMNEVALGSIECDGIRVSKRLHSFRITSNSGVETTRQWLKMILTVRKEGVTFFISRWFLLDLSARALVTILHKGGKIVNGSIGGFHES